MFQLLLLLSICTLKIKDGVTIKTGDNPYNISFLLSYVEERPWWPIQKPQQRKKEESERQRGERDQIKFIDLRFENLYRPGKYRNPTNSTTVHL